MPITHEGTTVVDFAGANTLSPVIPAGAQADDLMIAFIAQSENTTQQTWDDDGGGGNGWTRAAYNRTTGGRDIESAIFYKFHTGTENTPTFTWNTTGSEPMSGSMEIYRGVDPAATIELEYANAQNDANPPNPAVTTVSGNTIVVFHKATHDDITAPAAPAGYTMRGQVWNGVNDDHRNHFVADYIDNPAAGTHTPPDWQHSVLNATPEYHTYSLSLTPLSVSYSVVGSTLVCVGSPITSANILSNLNSLGLGSGHHGNTTGGKHQYYFNANIQIGSTTSTGSASSWDCSKELVKINGSVFDIYGECLMGSASAGGISQDGGSMAVVMTANDQFRVRDNGTIKFYGSSVCASHRIRVDDNAEAWFIDCDTELEDGVSVAEGSFTSANSDVRYDRSRIHHTSAVGIKLYSNTSNNTITLPSARIEECTFAVQVGAAANLSPVLRDLQIDSCTFHIVPNQGNALITFINPDFTQLRAQQIAAADVTNITFRYALNVLDSTLSPVEGARVIITDQSSEIQSNNTTDASGNVPLPTFDGTTVLFNATYAGLTRTERTTTTRSIASYTHNLRSDSFDVVSDFVDNVSLVTDVQITESDSSVTGSLTSIENAQEFYDAAKLFLIENYTGETDTVVTRAGDTIDAGSFPVEIVASAAEAFAFDGTTITIASTDFTGTIQGDVTDTRTPRTISYGVTGGTLTVDDASAEWTVDGAFTVDNLINSDTPNLTINVDNGANVSTSEPGTGNGQVFVAPPVRTFQLTGLTTGTKVYLIDRSAATPVEVDAGSEVSGVYTYDYGYTADLTVRVTVISLQEKPRSFDVVLGNLDQTIPINQSDDFYLND